MLYNHWDRASDCIFVLLYTFLMTYSSHILCIIFFCTYSSAKILDIVIMTSRKRNKGKERKAKKEADKMERERGIVRNTWVGYASGMDYEGRVISQCNHGLDLTIPDDINHPVINFIDALVVYWVHNLHYHNNMNVGKYLQDTYTTHPQLWGNESYREMTVNIFIAIGTNFMLKLNNEGAQDVATALRVFATAIVALENYDGSGYFDSVVYNRVASTKMRDINGSGNMRDVLKFFRKRTSCKCLKAMHLDARKTLPKTGVCYHCEEVKERALLMVCSSCRIAQYCSRECQVADWAEHKGYCKECVSGHKQQQAKKR